MLWVQIITCSTELCKTHSFTPCERNPCKAIKGNDGEIPLSWIKG